MKYTLYYHDRAIDPISVLGQIYAPDTTGGVNIASVFFSDYNYSEAANSSTKTNVLSDHLIWEQPSIYDWDYDVVHERAGFSEVKCVDLEENHTYKVECIAAGGRADHVSNKHGRPNTNKIAGGGGGGSFTFRFNVKAAGYKLYTSGVGNITRVQIKNRSESVVLDASAERGRHASAEFPGKGGSAVVGSSSDSNIVLESKSTGTGGSGGSDTVRHSRGEGSVSGGCAGGSVSGCFKMPRGAFTAFIDKITKFWSACLAVNDKKKPTTSSTVSAKNYNSTLNAQAKIFDSFKKFCHGFNKIKIPESSGTHKYLKWNYLSDADDTHISSINYVNIKSDSITVKWKDGGNKSQKITIWLQDSTTKAYSCKLRSEIYSNSKFRKKTSYYLNCIMTASSDVLITNNGSSGNYGQGQGFCSTGWDDSNPNSSRGTNYVRVTILD